MTERSVNQTAWMAGVVESSNDAIFTTDCNGIITSWNPAAQRIYGYAAAEAIGQPNRLIVPPGKYVEEAEVWQRIAAGHPVEHYDTVRRRKDGVQIDVSVSVSPLRGRDGRIVGVVKIARDISERKRAEVERVRAEQRIDRIKDESLAAARRLAAIVESSDDAIIGMDLDGTITAWNAAAERLYGYDAAEAIGRPITVILPHERLSEETSLLEQIKRGERLQHYETILVAKTAVVCRCR